MRLPKPFYRLPVRFDVERLRAEVAALPAAAWVSHPNSIEGNSALRLISVGGDENDDVSGPHAADGAPAARRRTSGRSWRASASSGAARG